MKPAYLTSILILLLLRLSPAFPAESNPDPVIPPGAVNFIATPPVQVLDIYAEMARTKLVTSSHVRSVARPIKLRPQVALKQSEVVKLIEKALLEQAGIVITKLDDNRVSVTYNDALPITAAPTGKPIQQ